MKIPSNTTQGVPSPCISLCQIDEASGLCKGCFRSIDEIIAWGTLPDHGKAKVWQLIEARLQQFHFS